MVAVAKKVLQRVFEALLFIWDMWEPRLFARYIAVMLLAFPLAFLESRIGFPLTAMIAVLLIITVGSLMKHFYPCDFEKE